MKIGTLRTLLFALGWLCLALAFVTGLLDHDWFCSLAEIAGVGLIAWALSLPVHPSR